MSRPPKVPYAISGSTLIFGGKETASVSLADIPMETIHRLALTYLAGKALKIEQREGIDGVRRIFASIATNGRVTRQHIPRMSDAELLMAHLCNFARERSGFVVKPLPEAAEEYRDKFGEDTNRFAGTEAMKAAQKRLKECVRAHGG